MFTARSTAARSMARPCRGVTSFTALRPLGVRRRRRVLTPNRQGDAVADDTVNEISGGIFFSAVIQGRNITVQLPPQVTPALAGLPDESRVFAGRDADLKQLMDLLNPAGPETAAVRVSAVAGMGGVGKTELVLHAAHAALRNGWFPGGVLFVDVFGYDPQRRVEAGIALEGMLRAAGIPGE